MRKDFLPFHVPTIGEEEVQEVVATLRSGWLTTGPRVKQFEQEFARYIGCQQAVAVNSGTAALHLALDAVGITEGDEVVLPTMTFTATAEVVTYLRARPVLLDCQPDTLNLDPEQIERAISPNLPGVTPTDTRPLARSASRGILSVSLRPTQAIACLVPTVPLDRLA